MHRRAKSLVLALTIPGAAAVLFGVWVYWTAKSAEPPYAGSIESGELSADSAVVFGPRAVPSIRAQSLEDLFFIQGYIEASERMWQMDLLRRLPRGRLSELFGEPTLAADRLFRTLDLEVSARRSLAALSPRVRGYLEDYARGVNSYRESAASNLPLEYRLLRAEPAPWTALDSIAIGEYMAFALSFNAREEIAFLKIASRIGQKRALELFPCDEGIAALPPAAPLPDVLADVDDPFTVLDRLATDSGLPLPGAASNAWVLSVQRTTSGYPLLANDPHLAPSVPGIWYELELEGPGYHAAGISLPGVPFVVIGHNAEVAWGMTTVMADTQDIVIERSSGDGTRVERAGNTTEPLETRWDSIPVRGRSEPERLLLRRTSNGIVLNDVLTRKTGTPHDFATLKSRHLIVLRGNFDLPDRALEGLFELNTASDAEEVRQALGLIRHAAQNVLYALRDGHTGWQVTGALPERQDEAGSFPTPGWLAGHGWSGYLPYERNPSLAEPGHDGTIVTANNRTIPPDYPVAVTCSWMPPYRAERIRELLGRDKRFSATELEKVQMDRLGVEARRYQQAARRLEPKIRDLDAAAWRTLSDMLLQWDATFDARSIQAAFFVYLREGLAKELFGDELGQDFQDFADVSALAYNGLQEAVRSGNSSFWDDVETADLETPAQIWVRAVNSASQSLEQIKSPGKETALGDIRQLVFPHAFHRIPVLGRLFDVGPMSVGGDDHTVNVAKTWMTKPRTPLFIPTYRVVFTPDDWRRTRGTQPLGQSGHRFSAHRTDQLADWLEGRSHRWPWGGFGPDQEILGVLRFRGVEKRPAPN